MNTPLSGACSAGGTVHLARKTALVMLAASLASCSSFNPYQRTELAAKSLEAATQTARDSGSLPLAGNLDGAMLVLADQQREWYESLSSQARTRALTQLTLIGATAAALFEGLRTGGNVSEDSKRRLAQAATLGAVAYFGGDWYLNSSQEDAYIGGFRKLSCVMLQIEPFKLSEAEFKDTLASSASKLSADINDLDKALLIANATHRYPGHDRSPAAQVRREAVRALQRARITLAASQRLQAEITRSGNTLLRAGELIFADTAAAIKQANKPLSDPLSKGGTSSIGNLRTIAKAFTAVSVDPINEEKKSDDTDKDTSDPAEVTEPAPAAGTTSTPLPPQATEGPTSAPAKAKAGTATTPLKEASPQALIDELVKKLGTQYDAVIAGLEKKFKQQTVDAQTAADKAIRSAKRAEAAAQQGTEACKRSDRKDCELVADVTAKDLAEKIATLYASRRPLSDRLTAFYNAGKAAGANRACTGQTHTMTVAPADDAKVTPGQEYTIQIGNLPSPPGIAVNGPATYKLEVSAAFTYTLRLTVADGAQGNVQVHISGGNAGSEDITLTVAPAKSAASKDAT